jgi:hypothetical protein
MVNPTLDAVDPNCINEPGCNACQCCANAFSNMTNTIKVVLVADATYIDFEAVKIARIASFT